MAVSAQQSLNVVQVPVSDLRASEYNPRKMTEKEADDLAESIRSFGLVEPLVVNAYPGRENVLVGGHQRLNIAVRLGYTVVPCVYVSLDETRERELNLRLNKNTGGWDWDALANLDPKELLFVGFSEDDLRIHFQLGMPTNPQAEWAGMPEFEQRDAFGVRHIVVHFKTAEAVAEFVARLGLHITDKTRFAWFPEEPEAYNADKQFIVPSEAEPVTPE